MLSGNTAGIITVLYASLLALPVPFTAVHLLFINLLTDSLPAIALGVEPHNAGVMKDKPRNKNASILTKSVLINIVIEGIVIALATIGAYSIGLMASPEHASTMAFATLCLSRLVHGFNCKSRRSVWFKKRMFNNSSLIGAFVIGLVLLNLVLFVPVLQPIFAIAPLSGAQVGAIYLLAAGTFVVIQLIKTLRYLGK